MKYLIIIMAILCINVYAEEDNLKADIRCITSKNLCEVKLGEIRMCSYGDMKNAYNIDCYQFDEALKEQENKEKEENDEN